LRAGSLANFENRLLGENGRRGLDWYRTSARRRGERFRVIDRAHGAHLNGWLH